MRCSPLTYFVYCTHPTDEPVCGTDERGASATLWWAQVDTSAVPLRRVTPLSSNLSLRTDTSAHGPHLQVWKAKAGVGLLRHTHHIALSGVFPHFEVFASDIPMSCALSASVKRSRRDDLSNVDWFWSSSIATLAERRDHSDLAVSVVGTLRIQDKRYSCRCSKRMSPETSAGIRSCIALEFCVFAEPASMVTVNSPNVSGA